MGFVGPERGGVIAELGLRVTDRGNVWRDENWMTSEEGIFAAGDMQRGQSLIVWAIADGRNAAAAVDHYLMGESADSRRRRSCRRRRSDLPGAFALFPARMPYLQIR